MEKVVNPKLSFYLLLLNKMKSCNTICCMAFILAIIYNSNSLIFSWNVKG